jgi:hypothetical protein
MKCVLSVAGRYGARNGVAKSSHQSWLRARVYMCGDEGDYFISLQLQAKIVLNWVCAAPATESMRARGERTQHPFGISIPFSAKSASERDQRQEGNEKGQRKRSRVAELRSPKEFSWSIFALFWTNICQSFKVLLLVQFHHQSGSGWLLYPPTTRRIQTFMWGKKRE